MLDFKSPRQPADEEPDDDVEEFEGPEPMDEEEIAKAVNELIDDAMNNEASMQSARLRAMQYYRGEMHDIPNDENRSSVVSRDVRAAVRKVMPALMRVFLGSEKMVEYEPSREDEDDNAEAATTYVNHVFLNRCNGYKVVWSACEDALLHGNGVVKYWWDASQSVTYHHMTDLGPPQIAVLQGNSEIEIIEQEEEPETDPSILALDPKAVNYDVRIKRTVEKSQLMVAAVPPEEFLISSDATCIDDAMLVGHRIEKLRGQLVAMGFPFAKVADIPGYTTLSSDMTRQDRYGMQYSGPTNRTNDPSIEKVEICEVYARVDADGDGIPEMIKAVMGGAAGSRQMLEWYPCDEQPFADVVCEIVPHARKGRGLFDDVEDLAQVKTVLTRQTLDNLYWQNNPQPIVDEGAVSNPESITNPQFGVPIRVKSGRDVRAAVNYSQVPFVAKESFAMLQYVDSMIADRLGMNDASGGLDPDALQNQTATAVQMMQTGQQASVELIARTMADGGFKKLFQGILRLLVMNQEQSDYLRLNGKMVQFSPDSWNADMNATVNTGLGAGSRDRDLAGLQLIMAIQEKLIASTGGADNPYVLPDQVYNTCAKITEVVGMKSPDPFFTRPDPAKVEQLKQEAAQKLPPEIEILKAKAQADTQIAAGKAQSEAQLNSQKAQSAAQLEGAKAQAAHDAAQAKLASDAQVAQVKLQADTAAAETKLAMETRAKQVELQNEFDQQRAKLASDIALQREKMINDIQLAREQMLAEITLKREQIAADAEVKHEAIKAKEKSTGTGARVEFGGETG